MLPVYKIWHTLLSTRILLSKLLLSFLKRTYVSRNALNLNLLNYNMKILQVAFLLLCKCIMASNFHLLIWSENIIASNIRGFSTVHQSLTERGLKGDQEKKERIKEKRFDAC